MPIEQRVVSTTTISPRGGDAAPADAAEAGPPAKGGRRKLVLVLLAVVLLAGAAAAYLLLGRGGAPEVPEPEPEPVAGQVLGVDPISLNLAEGHYLRIGIALQLSAEAGEEVDPSRALDILIGQYSGRTVAEVSDPQRREEIRAELETAIAEAYEGEVLEVWFTNYVTQ